MIKTTITFEISLMENQMYIQVGKLLPANALVQYLKGLEIQDSYASVTITNLSQTKTSD